MRKAALIHAVLIFFFSFHFFTEISFSLDLSPEEKIWLEGISPLRFSEVDWQPLSYTSDYPVYKGLIADYLDIISSSTGIRMEFILSETWQEVLDKFQNREIDLIPALALEDDVKTDVLFTDSYISFPLVIVTRSDREFIAYTHELKGEKVGVGKGYTSHNFMKNNYPAIELVTTANVPEGLHLLRRGKIDAFVGHLAVVMYAMRKYGPDLRIAGKTEYVFEHRMGLPPEHAHTVAIFNKVFKEISPEEHNRIYNKWIRIKMDRTDNSLAWKVLAATSFLIFIIICWNRKLSTEKKQFQQLLCDLNRLKTELEEKNHALNRLAVTDQLTGLYNRLKLDQSFQYEVDRSEKYGHSFGIILMDIDYFKEINDTYGHQTGDRILVILSDLILANTRKTDIIGRWGGEEFLIICPEIDEAGIKMLAEKLQGVIASFVFPEIQRTTASFGVTLYRKNDDIPSLMKRADEALYTAKKSGRNKAILN
ncbi:polar amino acid transport system substrate-binding protein [Desulfobotulus alkaliphilus]|uniref:diguanylate cyclase n=1 Tax=Desulfobotulus alkaliphilus TaxID=622671 RepID=A0A562RVK8_9BACT|nr:diguanylate cyclase [Desulfobotulus alkaliphilus]TWI72998.1 polar amino acid transport system substrate-binding protein [Desulfobotulus alkaliphilus]